MNIQELAEKLESANKKYYIELEETGLTDQEYDNLFAKLEEEYNKNPELYTENSLVWKIIHKVGEEQSVGDIVEHSSPMLSLEKAKTLEEVEKFVKKIDSNGADNYQLQCKLDGFALSIKYESGRVRLATRGNGEQGEDVSYLLNSPHLTILGIPQSFENGYELRGELFLSNDQFIETDNNRFNANGDRFKNSRNAVVGIMRKAKLGLDYDSTMTFSTYSIHNGENFVDLSEYDNHRGIITVNKVTQAQVVETKLGNYENIDELFQAIEEFGVERASFTIPTDGVVVKAQNDHEIYEKMGSTSHHPNCQIAFKYPGEASETIVEDIILTVGKTGKITPVAILEPVEVDGTTITRTTLNNFNWLYHKDVRIGSKVMVRRANDVIPEIVSIVEHDGIHEPIEVPAECPQCGSLLEHQGSDYPPKTLRCINDNCGGKSFYGIVAAVAKKNLDIDGLSESTIATLYENNLVKDFTDLYTLDKDTLANTMLGDKKVQLGEKRAEKILSELEKSKNVHGYKILSALNITGLGNTLSKKMLKHYSLHEIINLTVADYQEIEGIGDILAENLFNGMHKNSEILRKLENMGFTAFQEQEEENNNTLNGITISISGTVPQPFANRNALVDWIEENGGEFHSTPKKETTIMIGDPESTSSKIVKAKKNGTTIISPEDFTANYVN